MANGKKATNNLAVGDRMAENPIPPVAEPEIKQLREKEELKKLREEIRALEYANADSARRLERFKTYAAGAGLVTALVGAGTLGLSFQNGLAEVRKLNEQRIAERYERALTALGGDKAHQRLGGVTSLRPFLRDANRQADAAESLASSIAFEDDEVVRAAAVEALTQTPLDAPTARGVLAVLLTNSRGLVKAERLRQRALEERADPGAARGIAEARALSLGRAISLLARVPGVDVTDYSGIYCVGCSFRGMVLPKASFDDAILLDADLSNADLRGASFNRALLEGATFERADLREARVTYLQPSGEVDLAHPAIAAYALSGYRPSRVTFACADMRGARFDGQAWFPFVSAGGGTWLEPRHMFWPVFYRARLAGADFSRMDMYVITTKERGHSATDLPFVGRFFYSDIRHLTRANLNPQEEVTAGGATATIDASDAGALTAVTAVTAVTGKEVIPGAARVDVVGYRLQFGDTRASEPFDEQTIANSNAGRALAVLGEAFAESDWRDAKLHPVYAAWLGARKPRPLSIIRTPACDPPAELRSNLSAAK